MVARMKSLRALLSQRLASGCRAAISAGSRGSAACSRCSASTRRGIATLREQHHVYVPPDGRMNVAGISEANVDYVADSAGQL